MSQGTTLQDDLTIRQDIESIPEINPTLTMVIWLLAIYAGVVGAKLFLTRRSDARWLGIGLVVAVFCWAGIQFDLEFALRILVGGDEAGSRITTLEVPILRTLMELGLLMAAVSMTLVLVSALRIALRGGDLIRIQKAIMRFGLWVLGIFVVYELHFASGYSIKAIVIAVGGAMVFVLGLGLQKTLTNLFAGFDMQADAVFDKGDMVQVGPGGPQGTVWDTSLRSTRILTLDGEMLTIANGDLLSREVFNLDNPTRALRVRRTIGISYTVPPMKVKDVLERVLRQDSNVMEKPAPNVLLTGYGDSSINYELRFWVRDRRLLDEDADGVLTRVWYALHDNGISIPFPIRTLRMVNLQDEAQEAAKEEARVRKISDQIMSCPLFDGTRVTDAERHELARDAKEVELQAGEFAVRRGEMSDHMYLIVGGSVQVMLKDKDPVELAAPHWFGEMALLLKQPRSADVVAGANGARLVEFSRLSVLPVLNRRPEFAREIRNTTEIRRVASGLVAHAPEPSRLTGRVAQLAKEVARSLTPW